MNRNQRALALVAVFIISMLVYSSTLYLITANHIQFKLFTRNNDYNNDFGSESGNWTNSSDDFSGSGSGSGRRESSGIYPSPSPVVDPTCQTLQQLAANVGTCTTSDQCTGLYCEVSQIGSIDFKVEPCHNPPAVHVVGKDGSGRVIINRTLTQSYQQSLPGGIGTLNVSIGQAPNEDSLSLSVTVNVGGIPLTVIPETTIPLNREQCPQNTKPTQLISQTPQPSPTPGVGTTCASLEQLASLSPICVTSDQCTGLLCQAPGVGSFDFEIEPCHNPPAVHVVGKDGSGRVIINRTLTQSYQQSLPGGIGTLNVSIGQAPNEDSLSLSVTVNVGGIPLTVIPETTIPLNREQCSQNTKPTQLISQTPQPSPTPRVGATCASLEQLATLSPICVTSDKCTGLYCQILGTGSFDFKVESCHDPPAIQVIGRNSSGDVTVNKTLTKSHQQDLFGIGTLNVNIQQTPNEDSITFSVNIGSNIPAIPPLVVIPERRIPIDRTQCDSVPHSMMPTLYHTFTVASTVQTWTSTMDTTYTLSSTQNPAVQTQPPAVSTKNVSETLSSAVYSTATVTSTERTTPSAGPSQSITVPVAVSVAVILVAIGSVVLLIAIVMMIRRRRRVRREYHFQRMTFNTENDDYDDDEDL